MSERLLRDILKRSEPALDSRLYRVFAQLPFQLAELFIVGNTENTFDARYCMLKSGTGEIVRVGKHTKEVLNHILAAPGSPSDILRRVPTEPVSFIPDIYDTSYNTSSVYAQAIADPHNTVALLEAEYPNFFIYNAVRRLYRLRDLTLVGIPDSDGQLSAIARLFNSTQPNENITHARILEQILPVLQGISFEALSSTITSDAVETLDGAIVPFRVRSSSMKDILTILKRIALTDTHVLLLGESGVGKEVLAHWVHDHSRWKAGPFVAVNCAAIPESLMESELLGHEKGAFTGAHVRKIGKLELARNGTLFLDEVGDTSLNIQAKLLRVLQERKFQRLGGTTDLALDCRVITATLYKPKDLLAGRMREDFYYRISVGPIPVPSLRERPEDIPLIVDSIIQDLRNTRTDLISAIDSTAAGGSGVVTTTGMAAICRQPWPGNTRELKNFIERSISMGQIPITSAFVSSAHTGSYPDAKVDEAMRLILTAAKQKGEKKVLRYISSLAVNTACQLCEGVQSETAQYLGCAEGTVHQIVKRLRPAGGGTK